MGDMRTPEIWGKALGNRRCKGGQTTSKLPRVHRRHLSLCPSSFQDPQLLFKVALISSYASIVTSNSEVLVRAALKANHGRDKV